MSMIVQFVAASDLSEQFKLRKRGFLLEILSRTIIFPRYSTLVKRVSSVLKICIAHEKNAKNTKRMPKK